MASLHTLAPATHTLATLHCTLAPAIFVLHSILILDYLIFLYEHKFNLFFQIEHQPRVNFFPQHCEDPISKQPNQTTKSHLK